MKQLLTIVLTGFFAIGAFGALAQDSNEPANDLDIQHAHNVSLDEYLWLNRLVIVFADTDRDPAFQKQMALLQADPKALIERDVVVIIDTHVGTPSEIRDKLRPRGFGLVLIDKDGLVKLRKPSPWDVREISRSIDKTDLRQQELRDSRAIPPAK